MADAILAAHLRAVIMNQRIYPRGSPVVEEGISRFFDSLFRTLREEGPVSLSQSDGKIFVNQDEAPQAQALTGMFDEHEIQSLVFQPELTKDETRELVILLGQKKVSGTSFNDALRAQNVVHVLVNQYTVVEMTSEEEVVRKGDVHFRKMTSSGEVQNTLRESFNVIDKISEESRRNELRKHLAERLVSLESSLIKDLFDNPLPDSPSSEGLLDKVVESMPADKLRELFGEVVRWKERIDRMDSRTPSFQEEIKKLKNFSARLARAPEAKSITVAVFEDLRARGLLDGPPQGTESPDKTEVAESTVDVKQVAEGMEAFLLENTTPGHLTKVFCHLFGEGEKEFPLELLRSFEKTLEGGSPTARQMAAAEAPLLLDRFWEEGRRDLEDPLLSSLLRASDRERAPAVQKDLSAALTHVLLHDYRNRNFGRALQISGLFRKQGWEKNALVESRPREAREALHKAGNDLLEVIQQDLLSEDPAARDAADLLLRDLGDAAVPYYIESVKHSPDLRIRRLYGERLKNHPDTALPRLAAEFHVKNATPVLLNLLSILPDFISPEMINNLAPFIHFPDAAFRHEVLRMLLRIPGEKTDHFLLRFLDDPYEPIQREAIRAAGDRRIKEAVDQLVGMTRLKTPELQEEVCIALGKLGDERAVPALSALLKKEMFGPKVEETVRVRAAWALSRIPAFSAKQLLSSLHNDENPMIRELTQNPPTNQ